MKSASNWRFSRQIWLFLVGAFTLGLSQAFSALFLNFYLQALGLGAADQGKVNAIPALTSALMSIPAVAISRRLSNAHTIKIGSALGLAGAFIVAMSSGPLMALAGATLQGVGGALMMVSNSPFMANNSDESNRVTLFSLQSALMTGAGFLGNLIGGQVPALYAQRYGVAPDSLAALRAALLVAVGFQVAGLIPVLFLRPSGKTKPSSAAGTFAIHDKATMFRLVLPNILVGLGAGATIPYLNLFIEGKFGISYKTLGALFGWTSLATAATVLIQPWLVRRLGQLKAILVVQTASLPFLAVLGFAPSIWMVVAALFTRGALMNAAGPVYGAYAMSVLDEHDRPMYSATNIVAWNGGWAVAAALSGTFRQALGSEKLLVAFYYLFLWTILMYSLSIFSMYWGLYRPAKSKPRDTTTARTG